MRIAGASIGVVLAMLAACGGGSDGPSGGGSAPATGTATVTAKVTATVSYRERTALPPTAVIKVQLVDVSRADAPAVVVGEQVLQAEGRQVPFAFVIPYDPATIEANHTYAVQARIEVDRALRFVNDQRYAVLTRGAPSHVDIMLRAVGGG